MRENRGDFLRGSEQHWYSFTQLAPSDVLQGAFDVLPGALPVSVYVASWVWNNNNYYYNSGVLECPFSNEPGKHFILELTKQKRVERCVAFFVKFAHSFLVVYVL